MSEGLLGSGTGSRAVSRIAPLLAKRYGVNNAPSPLPPCVHTWLDGAYSPRLCSGRSPPSPPRAFVFLPSPPRPV